MTANEAATEESISPFPMITLSNDKVVPRKTVVLETLADPTVIKVVGERIKLTLFHRYGFLKPDPTLIQFVSLTKFYQPYIVVGARYFLDYYRTCTYGIEVEDGVKEVIVVNQNFIPEKNAASPKKSNLIKLPAEERLVIEKKAFVLLDEKGQEATLETLPSAPSEKNPDKTIAKYGITEIASEADIDFVRKKLVKRPFDVSRIVSEVFEIGERVVIYAPRFKLTYINALTYQEKTIQFDGVTSKIMHDGELTQLRIFRIIKNSLGKIHTLIKILKT